LETSAMAVAKTLPNASSFAAVWALLVDTVSSCWQPVGSLSCLNYRDSTCPSPQLRAVFCFPSRDETICNTASVTFMPMYGPTPVQRRAMFMSCFCNLLLGGLARQKRLVWLNY
jgi:hypothetical protein